MLGGTWIDDKGDIFMSTRGTFAVTDLSGDGADIFTCAPGSLGANTICTYSLFWDGSANGFAGQVIDGFSLAR